MPKMTFILKDGSRKEVEAPLGLSVLEIAHRNHVDIEGACEGSLACSTCHVVVEKDWFDRLGPASEDEEDMLDLAFGLTHTSRLGCQIRMSEALDGLVVKLPAATRNRGRQRQPALHRPAPLGAGIARFCRRSGPLQREDPGGHPGRLDRGTKLIRLACWSEAAISSRMSPR
jgi:2Fe-2S ferredoxin